MMHQVAQQLFEGRYYKSAGSEFPIEPELTGSSISRENVECQLSSMSSFGVIGTLTAGFALSNVYDTEPNTVLSSLVLITSTLCVCMNMSAVTILSSIYYIASRMLATSPTTSDDFLRSVSRTRHVTFRLTLGSVPLFIFSCVALAVEKSSGVSVTMIILLLLGLLLYLEWVGGWGTSTRRVDMLSVSGGEYSFERREDNMTTYEGWTARNLSFHRIKTFVNNFLFIVINCPLCLPLVS